MYFMNLNITIVADSKKVGPVGSSFFKWAQACKHATPDKTEFCYKLPRRSLATLSEKRSGNLLTNELKERNIKYNEINALTPPQLAKFTNELKDYLLYKRPDPILKIGYSMIRNFKESGEIKYE